MTESTSASLDWVSTVLPPPASEREIVAVESELGLVLPAQLRELYLFCGGGLSAAYVPIGRLAEVSIFIESIFREATGDYHGPDPKYVEASSLNTGPRSTRTLCVGGVSADVVVEVDGEDGSAGKVWRYHVHSPSNPWSLMSGSLEGHWGNLAALAEAGWYEVDDRSIPSVRVPSEARSDPSHVALMAELGLSHLHSYSI